MRWLLTGLIFAGLVWGTVFLVFRQLKNPKRIKGWIITGFHASLGLCILFLILSRLFRFEGEVVLTEGQILREVHSDYLFTHEGPLFKENHKGFSLMLDKLELRHVQDMEEYVSHVTLQSKDKSPIKVDVKVNHPYKFEGFYIYHFRQGFSPSLLIEDAEGKILLNSFVNLSIVKDEKDQEISQDEVRLSSGRLNLNLKYLPDKKNLHIAIKEHEKSVGEETIAVGETKKIGYYNLTFKELRRWSGLRLVKDPYLNMVYFSFILGIIFLAGIILR